MKQSIAVIAKPFLVASLITAISLLAMGCGSEPPPAPNPATTTAPVAAAATPMETPTPEPTPTATRAPADTPEPTGAPEPTATPTPTETPKPTPTATSTPAPTATTAPGPVPALTPQERDRAALIALYEATDGANWTNNVGWTSDAPMGEWYGVTVDDGRVAQLKLRENNLAAQIPSSLGDLTELNLLDLQGNELTGTIPGELGDLTNLVRLDLDQNQLSGQIPMQLGNLINLEILDIDFNELAGPVPSWLGNLTKLEFLSLGENPLGGPIPPELGNLTNLGILGLVDAHLHGDIPAELGNLTNLTVLFLNNNQLTGSIPPELSSLNKLERLLLAGNDLEGCVPAGLGNARQNDLDELGLPDCSAIPEMSSIQLGMLFDEIIRKTEQREAFSEVKERNIGYSALKDMKRLRDEFIASETEPDLYDSLWKLSNARRDAHLRVSTVDGGIEASPERECMSAPINVRPDYSDIRNPAFFVVGTTQGLAAPKSGDLIVAINGRSTGEHVAEITPWIRHSTLPGLYWHMAAELPKKFYFHPIPASVYREHLDLTLERPSGERYEVSLPYDAPCRYYRFDNPYPEFFEVMERRNFNVFVDRSRDLILLQWRRFDLPELIKDIPALMEYAEREEILDYDMIIDVSISSGGSGGAYAIQRLVDQPFRPTFGNVRLSDLGKARIERYASRQPIADAPDIFGLNLRRSWLYDWARTDATEAIRRGDEYTPSVPFKLAHLPKDSDGILQPAPVHFTGEVAIINGGVWGGSHLDQFVAIMVDNDLAVFIGMPTGGFSNTWEGDEILHFPFTGRPVARFQWTVGHTIRPNGEVLEGNPAQPHIYLPLTRENFREYRRALLDTAVAALSR